MTEAKIIQNTAFIIKNNVLNFYILLTQDKI